MNLSGRLTAIEKKAGTQAAGILFIVPDGTQHKMIDEGRAMTTTTAQAVEELATLTQIRFEDLPTDCQTAVKRDLREEA